MSQIIRIKLKSFDHMLVDKSAKKIVDRPSSKPRKTRVFSKRADLST